MFMCIFVVACLILPLSSPVPLSVPVSASASASLFLLVAIFSATIQCQYPSNQHANFRPVIIQLYTTADDGRGVENMLLRKHIIKRLEGHVRIKHSYSQAKP
jgi:hypothetical protein